MKTLKTLLIIIALIGIAAYSGQNIIIESARLDGFIYGNKSGGIDSLIVPDVDSLGQYKYKNAKDPINPLDLVNLRTLLGSSSSGWDSIPFNPATGDQIAYLSGAQIYTTNFDGRYIELSDTTDLSVTITQLNDSITVLNDRIDVGVLQIVYPITLPIAGTLAGSVALAIEGTDYPTGWILSASGGDLQVNHGLGRYTANTTVFYNTSGSSYRQLRNFDNAYSGVVDVDNNNVTIESISTFYTAYKLRVKILFE